MQVPACGVCETPLRRASIQLVQGRGWDGLRHHSCMPCPTDAPRGVAAAQVCEAIVIPNIRLREDLEEMFELNWVEYVRRDTEGSDQDTRRRAATDLVRALTAKFPQKVVAGPLPPASTSLPCDRRPRRLVPRIWHDALAPAHGTGQQRRPPLHVWNRWAHRHPCRREQPVDCPGMQWSSCGF